MNVVFSVLIKMLTNEPIMRRGLCPEGRRIREKHQGSLLNYEFGVTSLPMQKKIEKDHLRESVLRLKEIQAKCRGQELKLAAGCKPVKALRPKISNLPIEQVNGGDNDDISSSFQNKGENSHSDYFSISDQVLNNSIRDSIYSRAPDISKKFPSHNYENFAASQNVSETVPHCPSPDPSNNISNSVNIDENFYSEELETPKVSAEYKINSETDCSPNSNIIANNQLYLYIDDLKKKQIQNIITNIRQMKPACESDVNLIWKRIERDHRALFPDELCFTARGSASRVSSAAYQRTTSSKCSTPSPSRRGSAGLSRSKSLERIQKKSQDKQRQLPFEDFTSKLNYHCRSLSTKNLNANENYHVNSFQKPIYEDYSVSLPSLAVTEYPKVIESGLNSKSNTTVLKQKMKSVGDISREANNGVFSDVDSSTNSHGIASSFSKSCRNIGSQVNEKDLRQASLGSNPILRKNAYCQTGVQPVISKQPKDRTQRSKLSNSIRLPGQPPPTYRKGQLPKYLKARKEEARRNMEAAASVDPDCPPNHEPLPDCERRNTLHLLKTEQASVMRKLSTLPLVQDTARVKNARQEFESKLTELEDAIRIFSQPKVFISKDERDGP